MLMVKQKEKHKNSLKVYEVKNRGPQLSSMFQKVK